jgi:hypothetical protein
MTGVTRSGRHSLRSSTPSSTERTAVEAARRRYAFFAEASLLLAASLDDEGTLAHVARLAVPVFADLCIVDIVEEDGTLRRLSVVFADPAKAALVQQLQQCYPPDPSAQDGIARALRTCRSELAATVCDQQLAALARDTGHLRLLRALAPISYIITPLRYRGWTFGALVFMMAESGRRYNSDGLALAEELAHRAAVGIEWARLFR